MDWGLLFQALREVVGAFPHSAWNALSDLLTHWPLLVLTVLLVLLLSGLASPFGLLRVFHDDPTYERKHQSKSRWVKIRRSGSLHVQAFATWFSFQTGLAIGFLDVGGDPTEALRDGAQTIAALFLLCFAAHACGSLRSGARAWTAMIAGAIFGAILAWLQIELAQALLMIASQAPNSMSLGDLSGFAAAMSANVILITAIMVGVGKILGRVVLPGVLILVAFISAVNFYAIAAALPVWAMILPVVALGLILGFASRAEENGVSYLKFRFDGLGGEKDADYRDPYHPNHRTPADREAADDDEDAELRLVDPLVSLKAWAKRTTNAEEKPKLVIIATSGGAYRASFWTGLILDRLADGGEEADQAPLDRFAERVRLITGASGGMVSAAYFAEQIRKGKGDATGIVDALETDIERSQSPENDAYPLTSLTPTPRDSFTPVATQLVFSDFFGLFRRRSSSFDRGHALERQWLTLDTPFAASVEGEEKGESPSIIFTPTLVETGQPLIISNLNLTRPMGEDRGDFQSMARNRRERAYLFSWFPKAQATFKLQTAVRMSASFPYISPTTALPTKPYRRVADAGYYDNYGIDMAVAYLTEPEIRDAVLERTSGVAIIEIRAFPRAAADKKATNVWAQFLTTPLEAVMSARGSTNTFRNEQSFRRAQKTYGLSLGDERSDFLSKFTFELDPQDVDRNDISLNWFLSDEEMTTMERALDSAKNRRAFLNLRHWWNRDSSAKGDDENVEAAS